MKDRIPAILFGLAVSLALVGYGILIGKYEVFPYSILRSAVKTAKVLKDRAQRGDLAEFKGFVDVAPNAAASNRIEFVSSPGMADPVLFFGGRFQFTDHCPGTGCLAVAFAANGEVIHPYPYRPNEIFASNISHDFPYEAAFFKFERDAYPVGIEPYPNGDLLVTFQTNNTYPYSGGVARIDRDGHPLWFRRDYSHHWPVLLEGEIALIPSFRIGARSIEFKIESKHVSLACDDGNPYLDMISVLSGDGKILRRISVIDAILDSPYRAVLHQTTDPCDPTHLNYAITLCDDVNGAGDIDPGDLVVSLRNVSAFGILDADGKRLKRLVRGTFFKQHCVQHLDKARFLMFDNQGGDATGGPSRLLMVDMATGTERTVFPTEATPEPLRNLFSNLAGKIDISPDRLRAIVTFTGESKAVEVRLADGAVLSVFSSWHDVSKFEQFSQERREKAARFRLYGVDYLPQPGEN